MYPNEKCQEYFADLCISDDCGLLIDLMTYLIVEEENAGQYYPDFAYNHPL
ncbi:MAG: hypothetical protein PUE12_04195 [Oscillospiraceae bacterium]|nr:hypothetical protein [Oscillospiraceae bacterium]